MGRWWQRIIQIRNGLGALGLWLAVVILPLRIEKLPEAFRWWRNIMPARETLLILLSSVLVAWIFWSDLRPSVYRWWGDRNAGDAGLRDVIWWIEKNSAWWRWQIAQGGLGSDEWSNYNQVAGQLWDDARKGKLTISARQAKEIKRENITTDFWQVGTLQVKRDDRTLYYPTVRWDIGSYQDTN